MPWSCLFFFLVNTSVGGFVAFVAPLAGGAGRDAIPHGPVGIKLHVQLTLLSGHLIVAGLFLATQRVPLFLFMFLGMRCKGMFSFYTWQKYNFRGRKRWFKRTRLNHLKIGRHKNLTLPKSNSKVRNQQTKTKNKPKLAHPIWKHCEELTRLPRIWLMAALSLSVHSATTLARISFM